MIDEVVTETSENNESATELESEVESVTESESETESEENEVESIAESESETESNESGNVNYIVLEAPTTETIDYTELINSLSEEQSAMYELVSLEYAKQYELLNESSHSLSVSVSAVRVIMVVLLLAWLYLLCGRGRKH